MNLYQQINDWLLNYTPLNSWLYFNATPFIDGVAAMNSVPGDRVTRKFIDGSMEKQIVFAIDFITTYDQSGTSTVNMDSIQEVENFAGWIEEQKTYPDFGIDKVISKVEVLTNIPSMLVDNLQGLAKYQFQVRITYKDESEVIK